MQNCLNAILSNAIIPIVNENDVISITELMFTDNDELAGLISAMLNVDHLYILTNVDGIYDGDPKHGFIDISIRLREGRPQEVKEAATQAIFAAAEAFLEPVLKSRSLALSVEMRDIDASLSPKTGTVRQHMS